MRWDQIKGAPLYPKWEVLLAAMKQIGESRAQTNARQREVLMVVVVNEEVVDADVVSAADIVEMDLDGVSGNGAVLVVLLEREGGGWRGILGDLDGDPALVSHVVSLDVEHDGAGAVRKVEGLADAIGVLSVVLRRGQHEEVIVVNAIGGVADEPVSALLR